MDGGVTAGGSHTLGGLIDDHGDAIAADLSEHYQMDVRDLFRDGSGLSPRWVLLHIVQLPQSSRFYAEKRGGPQFRGWDESRYALAAVVNAVPGVAVHLCGGAFEAQTETAGTFSGAGFGCGNEEEERRVRGYGVSSSGCAIRGH